MRWLCVALALWWAVPVLAQTERAERFAVGQAARAAGDFDLAITAFRDVLREDPGDLRAREELGYALLLDRRFASAAYQFRLLLTRVRDPALQALYKSVLRRIGAERPYGFGLVFEVVPSSNLNAGSGLAAFETLAGTFDIAPQSQAQAGRLLRYGLTGFARHAPGGPHAFRLDGSLVRNAYDIAAVDDSTEVDLRLSWIRQTEDLHSTLAFGVGQDKSANDTLRHMSLVATGTWALGPEYLLDLGAEITRRRYAEAEFRDGHSSEIRLRLGRVLSPDALVWAGVTLERARPGQRFQRYDGTVVQFGGQTRLAPGLTMEAVLSRGRRDFAAPFPLQVEARADRFTEISVSARSERLSIGGFTPRLTCRARVNRSNIGLFASDAQDCGLALSGRF